MFIAKTRFLDVVKGEVTMKKFISILLCTLFILGSFSFNVVWSTNASTYELALNSKEKKLMEFIVNDEYKEAIVPDGGSTSGYLEPIFSFNVYDFDGDGELELVINTVDLHIIITSIFKVINNRVECITDAGLYKSSYSYLIKGDQYYGFVCPALHQSYGPGICSYFSMDGVKTAFQREFDSQGNVVGYNFDDADEIDDELLDLLLDEDANGNNNNLVPLYFFNKDEIDVIGWNEFFHPTWSRTYYYFFLERGYSEEFINSANPEDAELGLKDLNKDGIPELIVGDPWNNGTNGHGNFYTYKNGNVKYIGSADAYGGTFFPHEVNNSNYPGIWTYLWYRETNKENDMPFHLVYFEYDGTKILSTDVCADYTTAGSYERITSNLELYNAIIESQQTDWFELTTESDIEFLKSHNSNAIGWVGFLAKYLKKTPLFYYTNGDVDGSHEFTYYDVEKYIREKPSTEYDPRMAAFAATMANAASSEYNLKKTFEELGIPEDDYQLYHYDGYGLTDPVSTAFSIAHQNLINGETIIYVTFRGTRALEDGIIEWIDNFISTLNPFSDGTGPHMGFKSCCDDAFIQLIEYEQSHGNITNSNYTYVITGHSRGAAAANLLAVKLMDERNIKKSNLFCYTIACPDSAANYTDDWNNYNKSNKYNNIFNINNVKDPVPYVPGTAGDLLCNIWNTPSSFVKSLFGGKDDMVRWDKYGISMWYSWDWTDDRQVSIDIRPNGNNVHNQYEYWRYLSTLKTDFKDRNSTQALASGLAEALGNLISIRCPVDVFITDKTGKNIASVIDGKTNYYDSEVGEVLIFVREDQKAVYLGKENDYNIKLVATDSGKMRVDLLRINPFTSEIDVDNYAKYENVSLVQGKTMVAELSKDKLPQDVKLFVVDESTGEKKTVINSDGSEAEYNDSLDNVNIYVGKATTVERRSTLGLGYFVENIPLGYKVRFDIFKNGNCISTDYYDDNDIFDGITLKNGKSWNEDHSSRWCGGTRYIYDVEPSEIYYKVSLCNQNGVIAVDNQGKEISRESGKITVKDVGFFKRIILFFKALFGKLPTIEIRSGF